MRCGEVWVSGRVHCNMHQESTLDSGTKNLRRNYSSECSLSTVITACILYPIATADNLHLTD